jgi:predicted RNA-binding Zn ribbon-like protein
VTARSTTFEASGPGPRSFAVDLANTVECPGCRGEDALESVVEARRWLRSKVTESDSRVVAADLPALRRFRTELRALLQAAADRAVPSRAALASINRAAGDRISHPELRWDLNQWEVEERGDGRSTCLRLTTLAARSAIDLLGRTHPLALRRCQGPECIHFLVARRSQQRWCSPSGCGNRARVQRHYRKLRSLSGRGTSRPGRGKEKA